MEDLLRTLWKATIAKIISWEPTGDEVECAFGKLKGYKTRYNDVDIELTIKWREKKKSFFSNDSEPIVGLIFKTGTWEFVISGDQKTIPGQEYHNLKLKLFALDIQYEIENGDINNSLNLQLKSMY